MQLANGQIHVSLFCGGRGSATIVRELLRWPNVQLNLLVNAYDDGLSTGELRDFIPGMLGPSDFRKNLSYLLDLYSNQQYALQKVLEYRLPIDFSDDDLLSLEKYVNAQRAPVSILPVPMRGLFAQLDGDLREKLCRYLVRFFHYYRENDKPFKFADCSLGNLLFAGAYLHHHYNFNAATKDLAELFCSQARLINVSNGENRSLAALKENGQILFREADIVGPQSENRIETIFFLPKPVTDEEKAVLEGLPLKEKRARLSAMEAATEISDEAREALLDSDIIIYGPGTQFSSLMPSYRVRGLSEAVKQSRAELKTLVMNLKTDYDIRGMNAGDIANKILEFIGDEDNSDRCITHILHNRNSSLEPDGIRLPARLHLTGNRHKNAAVVQGDFENPANSNVHSGYAVVRRVMELFDVQRGRRRQQTLDIFVDLLSRSIAFDSIVQEFLELPWRDQFCKVRLFINGLQTPSRPVPEYLEIHSWSATEPFAELSMLREWLAKGDSEYLVTLTGDGEYRLRDILSAVTTINNCNFGVLFGSRTQSRKQFATSLRAAYGEGTMLFWLSWLGAFMLSTLFALRFQLVFSDTLTGFRIYKGSRLSGSFREAVFRGQPRSALAVARLLVSNSVEIAEMPVNYRTFRGFTKVSWRMRHALENAIGIFI